MPLRSLWIPVMTGLGLLAAADARGQVACQCDFSAKDYSAVGTKAACNAFVYDGKRCEVSFSSLGANMAVASRLESPASEDKSYQLAIEHVTLLRKRDYVTLSSERFLADALPLMMRSTYARAAVAERLPIVEIDKEAMAFLDKYRAVISAVFAGKQAPIDGKWGPGYRYAITRGSLVFETPKSTARLTVVVFRPE